ncbi:YicC/YloC family endoribonuclease [Flavobacterium branchiophilum]
MNKAFLVYLPNFFLKNQYMIQSMTGYGKANLQLPTKKIIVEIKSLNSKGLDLNVRMSSVYKEMELGLRNEIASKLERGKIDFSIFIENVTEQTTSKVNVPIVKAYIAQLQEVYATADQTELMKMAVRMPDALKTEREEIDENEWQEIQKAVQIALQNIQAFRISEGQSLEKEFRHRIANIKQYMQEALALDPERVQAIKDRLQTAINELKVSIDENRFEQELIYYLEKLDITEEKVRLSNHLDYFIETLEGQEANGRKLGFITQEMGREINTMGSKSNHAEMQKLVVQMKDELEKIKEQVLNVL